MKEQQLKSRSVKLWITFLKSALKSERSNSGSASRCGKEAKLRSPESRFADSGETVAGLHTSQMWEKYGKADWVVFLDCFWA